ncbi:3-oxo-Delta(4,5)-steroid 5-beta-reductase-like [Prunus dulcis]|uniref:3-oxo-Delta(4,5)-steroid 5-beta-reductase-like n=1 Tax=Prunus dulcis TaxID=3755 RepID=UPI0014831526|nr:3-oxo-Delta(4,5)-steroid 5-beta-reductase-like [Prunus dulcis]
MSWVTLAAAAKKHEYDDHEAPRSFKSVGLVPGRSTGSHAVHAQIGALTTPLNTSNATSPTQLAEEFEIEEYGFDEGFSLVEMMRDKGGVWEEIVGENQLRHAKLEEVGLWEVVEVVLGGGAQLSSMNKNKEHGFCGFRNSRNSFVYWIDKMKAHKIVP